MTIKEISEMAGVSLATVSLALNGKPGVSEETRERIVKLANDYGYNKRNMTPKQSILFIKYIGNGAAIEHNGDFVARIIDAIEESASHLGYSLVMKNVQPDEFEKEIKSVGFEEFAGAILLATEVDIKDSHLVEKIPIPIVAVDNMFENYDVDSVVMDNYGGIYTAVKHLYELGHREIGYIDSTIRFSNFDQRTVGYCKALESFKIPFKQEYMYYVQANLQGSYDDMLEELNKNKPLPTAFIAANDTIAIGVIKALKEREIEIPEQISVIGFDDIPFCKMLDKSLTTMRVNKEQLGEEAVKLLDSRINNRAQESVKILTRTKLIVRESTCRLPINLLE